MVAPRERPREIFLSNTLCVFLLNWPSVIDSLHTWLYAVGFIVVVVYFILSRLVSFRFEEHKELGL